MLRLESAAPKRIVRRHEAAADELDALASTAPADLDGGLAQEHLLATLAELTDTSGDLVTINRLLAAQVRRTARDLASSDGATSTAFGVLGSNLTWSWR